MSLRAGDARFECGMSATARNVLIVLALAAAVYAIPGGRSSADFIASILSILITASIAFFGWRLYREHRVTLFSLGDRYRGLLYGAVGAAVLMMAARGRLFDTTAGTLLWFAVIGAASYALVVVYRFYRSYEY